MARTTSKSSTITERPQREAIHPGEFLGDELEELKMSASELARVIRVPPNRVSQILAGKRAISADTALRLGRYFGTGPTLWLNLQQAYELDLAEKTTGRELTKIPVRANAAE